MNEKSNTHSINDPKYQKKLIPLLQTILSVVLIALVVALVVILVNVYCSNLQLKSDYQNNVSGVQSKQLQTTINTSTIVPPKTTRLQILNSITPGVFYISPNQAYIITSNYNFNQLFPVNGAYNQSLINGNATALGGIVTNYENFASENNLGFTLVRPSSNVVISNGTFLIQNPTPSTFQTPWAGGFATVNQATSDGGSYYYVGTTLTNNGNNLQNQWNFIKIQDLNTQEGVFIIQNLFNNLFMRICDTQGCIGCGNALTCGGGTLSTQFVSVDYSVTQANADPRAQWILTAI